MEHWGKLGREGRGGSRRPLWMDESRKNQLRREKKENRKTIS
jgi:hypothetical protein